MPDEEYIDSEPLSPDEYWAVGLFEGEGCITISHGRQRNGAKFSQPRLHLNSTDEDVVRRFHGVVGVGTVCINHGQERRGWKRQWRWQCSARRDVREVLVRFFPHFGLRRQCRAIDVLVEVEEGRPARW